ncbi:MAG: hypothetical protein CL677_06905 [Bdellovibrionaceae bacterium]|nr:hypothetical protein [Pseudobdellovibrionaceae bacterium]|tara:strand:+ start:638 stop:1141 length:504 start_codon:yes stop_codon:yes gene_type:complete
MKRIWTKKIFILVFLVLAFAGGGHLLSKKWGISVHLLQGLPLAKAAAPQSGGELHLQGEDEVLNRKGPTSKDSTLSQMQNSDSIKGCYVDYLMSEPAVDEGQMVFHWTLTQEGYVDTIKLIHSDMTDGSFTDCVEEAVIKTKFSVSQEKLENVISHRFRFERDDMSF